MKTDFWPKFEYGLTYHFYNRFASDTNPLEKEEECESFLIGFKKYFFHYVDVYAFCLLPNHFHFVFQVKVAGNEILDHIVKEKTKAANRVLSGGTQIDDFLTDQMRQFFSSFSLKFNKKNRRIGNLFQEKTRRVLVKSEQRLQYLICYLHHNPIHHKYVMHYDEWKYSSYNHYKVKRDSLIDREHILKWLGDGDSSLGLDIFLRIHKDFRIDPKYYIKNPKS